MRAVPIILAAIVCASLRAQVRAASPPRKDVAPHTGTRAVSSALGAAPMSALMPRARDYAFMWWPYGWRGRSAEGRRVLCFRTGWCGLALDVEHLELLHFGPLAAAKPYLRAASEDNADVFSLPSAALELTVRANGRVYRCVRAAADQHDMLNFPIRMIESGRLLQRADILKLEFEDAQGDRLPADGRLEIVAWPDRLALLLDITPQKALADASARIAIGTQSAALTVHGEQAESRQWPAGERKAAWLAVQAGPESAPEEAGVTITASSANSPGNAVNVTNDGARGWSRIELPAESWNVAADPDHLDRVELTLTNRTDGPRTARLLFARDHPNPGIIGMTPMLRDSDGYPTGIPVQLSKNWHRTPGRPLLYEGPWFHGFSLLHLPPRSTSRLELAITYAHWGGVPAASHAQLCLIGWGVNQLWHEAAIGSWGESICYDPDVNLNRSMIDDVRPLMVTAMGTRAGKWGWTSNVGGGDFLAYRDLGGAQQYLTRVRSAHLDPGPNLTDVVYTGITADGHIAARIEAQTPRSDDVNRAYHHLRYDVLKRTPFSRIAFYQVGADRYNDHQFERLARGNESGLTEEWSFIKGGRRYDRAGVACTGHTPWISMHRGLHAKPAGGAWADRGLVIRSWKARLGGHAMKSPCVSFFGTENGPPSMNVEISPPPDVHELLPGDFVDAEVELVIMPMSAEDYYGPNENLRSALRSGGDTWRPIWREAAGNDVQVMARRGTISRRVPIIVRVDATQRAEIDLRGGIGYVPITFVGLRGYRGYALDISVDGERPSPLDQAVHGHDFWQTAYDPVERTWSRTYNVSLDTPNDLRRTVRLDFTPIRRDR